MIRRRLSVRRRFHFHRAKLLAVFVAALVAHLPARLRADDWPCWRGPDTLGVSVEKDLPVQWSANSDGEREGIAFAVDLIPWGNSSPVIVGDRVYLTSQDKDDVLWVAALRTEDASGVWKRKVGKGALRSHELHNMASPSVVAEKDRIWALFGTGDLVALDRDGEVRWQRNLAKEHGEYKILWGMASSPLVIGDRLYVVCTHSGPSYVLAIDKETGKDAWKRERELPCVGEATDSYSTPAIARYDGRTMLVVAGADHVNAYDPRTGDQIWISDGLKIAHDYGRSIASPTYGDGVVIAASSNYGRLGRVIAVPAGGRGDISGERKWTFEKASPDCPTPLVHDGLVYMVRDDGVASCVDLATGGTRWQKRLLRSDVKASPIAGDGKVYFFGVRGEAVVVKAGPEGEELARNQIPAEALIATPALSGGRLWVRTREKLWVIGK